MRAVIVNAGNANCATGTAGYAASVRTAKETALRLNCHPREVMVCSTGVIGVPLPVEKILRALPGVARNRRPSARSFAEFSLAICTTDTRPKTASTWFSMARKRIHFVGCAKGAGMIHPNMATTLAFVATRREDFPSACCRRLYETLSHAHSTPSALMVTRPRMTLFLCLRMAQRAPLRFTLVPLPIATLRKRWKKFATRSLCKS